jgi:antitoxin ParD1/3/4
MRISLNSDLERLVRDKVDSGLYASESDVIGEALHLMDERDRWQDWRKNDIREKIAAGAASLRAGRGADGEDVFSRIDAELDFIERKATA